MNRRIKQRQRNNRSIRAMQNNKQNLEVGQRVYVDFLSSNRVETDGTRISGFGVLDRVEPDGFVCGRLDIGQPFGCPSQYVQPQGEELKLIIGNKYKWMHEPQILTYVGKKNGWHIFTFKDRPWCECLDSDLYFMEPVYSEFEKWYVGTYFTVHGLVPPANLFNKYEDTYIHSDVYRHNLVWQQQQVKVEELQQENQRLADGNTSYYNQAIKQNEIIDGLQVKLKQAYEDIDTFAKAHERECEFKAEFAKDKEELQKQVDLIQRKLNAAKEGHYGFKDEGADIDGFIFDLEQALIGGLNG